MKQAKEKTPRFNYTQNAWEGKMYDPNESIKDIAKTIRYYCKLKFPECKFSITTQTYSGGQSMKLKLMSAPFEVFKKVSGDIAELNRGRQTIEEVREMWQGVIDRGHKQVNQYHLEDDFMMTEKAREVMDFLIKTAHNYNFNDSDSQIDYFHNNFYTDFSIGGWDKPFELKKKGGV